LVLNKIAELGMPESYPVDKIANEAGEALSLG
jgi:hypothetical protein